MELNITKAFIDEEIIIREAINNLAVTDCICNFLNYIDKASENSFEKEYIKSLRSKKNDFIKELLIKPLMNMSKEDLYEYAYELQWEGTWAISDRENDEVEELIKHDYTDAEVYPKIKKIMQEALEELMIEKNKTAKQKEIDILKNRYQNNINCNINSIKRHEEQQRSIVEKLKSLGAEI